MTFFLSFPWSPFYIEELLARYCFKHISHQQLIVPLLYVCFQILCAVLIVNAVVLTITEGRPRYQTDADENVPHLTMNITGQQSSANVLMRSKRQTTKPLHDYCPGWSSKTFLDEPCVDAIFLCYGYTERVCKTAHASCGSAIVPCGFTKCEPGNVMFFSIKIDGQKTEVKQTLTCGCARCSS